MINKKIISAVLLAGSIILSMGTNAFAAQIPVVDENNGSVTITKNLEMAEGLDIPDVTFNFTATKITPDAPEATINPISYNNNDQKGTLQDGKYTIAKDSTISFKEFPHAGIYEYSIEETNGLKPNFDYSTEKYTLRVYVQNGTAGKLVVDSITAESTTTNNKVAKILFTNKYAKNDASLTIEKKTDGNLADKTKDFDFTITFTPSSMSNQTKFEGSIDGQPIICEAGIENSFKLHDSQKLVFTNLPVGTRYVVEEIGVSGDGYTPGVTVIENDIETVNTTNTDETLGLSSSQNSNSTNLVGEGTNTVTFVNTYKNTPITGIIMNNLPFLIVISVAFVALVALAIIIIKRTVKR